VDTDDLVSRVDHARGSDGRVDPAAHRGDDLHRLSPAPAEARRPRSTAAGSAETTASTSSDVDVWPRVSRNAPRACSSGIPMASSTWLGCGTPAWHAGTGRALDARRVEEVEQRVAVTARHQEVRVAGQPVGRVAGRPAAAHGDVEVETKSPLDEPVS
jgi:hypothetical protein